jgi:hypothetical protein
MSVIRKWVAMCFVGFGVLLGGLALSAVPALAAAPEVISESTSGVSGSEATLEAQINPESLETMYSFEYATSEAAIGTPGAKALEGSPPAPPLTGSEPQSVGVPTGAHLTPGETYYYRVLALNTSLELTEGPIAHFTTLIEAPRTRQATSIKGTSAVLNGVLNPNASGTAGYEFSYNVGESCEGVNAKGENAKTTIPGSPKTGKGVKVSTLVPVPELEALSEYTFCVFAMSPTETLSGGPKTFVTPASAPVVVSETPEPTTPLTEILKAEVNPENQPATSCEFEYGETITAHKAPCEETSPLGGSSPQTVSLPVAGLAAAHKYHYRVIVANATGTETGKEEEFETLPAVVPGEPIIEGENATAVAPSGATLEATINPEGQATTYVFEYATEESVVLAGGGTKVAGKEAIPAGFAGVTVSVSTKALVPGEHYFFRVVATNATGTKKGEANKEFKTEPPAVLGVATTAVTPSGATLEALINPEFQETKYTFEYATTKEAVEKSEGTKVVGATAIPAGPEVVVSVSTKALVPGEHYFYRVVATNATGTTDSTPIEQFKTEPPVVEGENATAVVPSGATLEATINPEGQATTYVFEYATEESVVLAGGGTKVAGKEAIPAGFAGVTVSVSTKALVPGERYFYRVVATNATGTKKGEANKPFKTEPPHIENEKVSESSPVTAIDAKLEAQINPELQKTTVTFEYSSEGAAILEGKATKVSGGTIPAGPEGVTVSADLGNALQPGTVYYYRVVAENETSGEEGKAEDGTIQHFATPAAPVITTAAAQNITENSATLSGTVNPEGGEKTKYHYAYIPQTSYAEALKFHGAPREIDPTFNPYESGASTPEVEVADAPSTVLAAQPFTLTGLVQGTEYHYALVATNSKQVGVNEKGEPIDVVVSTVISSGGTFKVLGTPIEVEKHEPTPEYPNGPLGAPAPVTPIPLLAVPNVKFPKEEVEPRKLTNAENLKKALKACKKEHPKSKRTTCEKQAHKRYASKAKKKKKK